MLALTRAVRCAVVLAFLLFRPTNLHAQAPRPRLHEALSSSARVPLPSTREPVATYGTDAGRVASTTRLEGVTLVFQRSPEQVADLQALLKAQLDPASTSFHVWLTPSQFGERFGMADADLQATRAWLQGFGLAVGDVPPSRDRLSFSGTVAQIDAALGTELHTYRLNSETHFAPADALALPAPLAAITAAVQNLNDLRPAPMVVLQSGAAPSPAPGANAAPVTGPKPAYTTSSSARHLLTPGDLSIYYNLTPLLPSTNIAATQGIAVVGQSAFGATAVSSFQNLVGTANQPYTVLLPNTGVLAESPGNETEAELDLEYASAIAQNAQIFYITPGDDANHSVFDSVVYAIQQNIAPIITISYGECETLISTASLSSFDGVFMQAAAQGQTVIASAGDSGSTECANYTGTTLTTAQLQATSVSYPASSPWVTAVGGTQMAAGTFTTGDATYWSATNSTSSPQGSSLRGYTPETVWNEGSASVGILAGGGGASAYFPRPSWQTGVAGLPSGNFRLIPDLSLQASVYSPGFLLCIGDPRATGFNFNTTCQNGFATSAGAYTVAGGTSFSAPVFAGMLAVLNQSAGVLSQGLLNPALYAIAAQSSNYGTAFHDIQTGTNGCTAGATNCSAQGQSAYPAGAGFDQASGLGTPNFATLKSLLPASSTQASKHQTSISFPVSSSYLVNGTLTVNLNVNDISTGGAQTAPSGTVAITLDGQLVQPALALSPTSPASSSTATFISTLSTATGTHIVQIAYAGDATHGPAHTAISEVGGSNTPSGAIAFSVPNLSIASGSTSASTQVTVTPSAGYHGRVYWSLSYTTSSGGLTACYAISPLLVTASGTSSTTFTINTGTACSSTTSSKVPGTTRASRASLPGLPWQHPAVTAAMAGLLLLLSTRRRRRLPWLLCLALVSLPLVTSSLTGCGSSQASGGTTTSQPVTPTPTVVGFSLTGRDSVSTGITAYSNFTLTVN